MGHSHLPRPAENAVYTSHTQFEFSVPPGRDSAEAIFHVTTLLERKQPLLDVPFPQLPEEHRVCVYGINYARFILDTGGELYLTQDGWGMSTLVLPKAWFTEQRYATQGKPLEGATGTVYRLPTARPLGATRDVVVKFSRVAQDVPLFFDRESNPSVPLSLQENVYFNDPFEEFALTHELRTGIYGPPEIRIRVKKPLAIYCPPMEYELWQLGRKAYMFNQSASRLQQDQARRGIRVPVTLHRNRDYIVLYQWVKGLDAEHMFQKGLLDEPAMHALHHRVNKELLLKGFVMLDNKPRHVILREHRSTGGLLMRHAEMAYALVDFELLKRTPDYTAWRADTQPDAGH
jgi:hypothetical protein